MLKTIPLENKPLCIIENNSSLYIGDAHGLIHAVDAPYTHPRVCETAPGPVSALVFTDKLYYGTWEGAVYTKDRSVRLGSNPIKCMLGFKGRLFVSVDFRLFVLDCDLNIVEKHDTESKIHCMSVYKDSVRFGMGRGLISSYTDQYGPALETLHGSTVMSMRQDVSGCTHGHLVRGGEIAHMSKEWIRGVWDENLFAAGKSVLQDGKEIYRHADDVVGILKVDRLVITIGLDYCYKIYETAFSLDDGDEKELLELLNS